MSLIARGAFRNLARGDRSGCARAVGIRSCGQRLSNSGFADAGPHRNHFATSVSSKISIGNRPQFAC